jgi:hypothetical protein
MPPLTPHSLLYPAKPSSSLLMGALCSDGHALPHPQPIMTPHIQPLSPHSQLTQHLSPPPTPLPIPPHPSPVLCALNSCISSTRVPASLPCPLTSKYLTSLPPLSFIKPHLSGLAESLLPMIDPSNFVQRCLDAQMPPQPIPSSGLY